MLCVRNEKGGQLAVECMKKGDVCVLPTDTVYGFSGIVGGTLDCAQKIRHLKGRKEEKPFIRLISEVKDIFSFTSAKIPSRVLDLWPCALTLIVKTPSQENPLCETAFRCPDDDWLREVIRGVGFPIYSTSANKSGEPILFSAAEIAKIFPQVPLIVDGGEKKNEKPSTIVRVLENSEIQIIRQGAIVV